MNREYEEPKMETPAEDAGRPDASTRGASSPDASSPDASTPAVKPGKRRTGPRQFLREVRAEMRRVAWPSRRELASYSIVVLVSVSILTVYIFGLDQAFGQVVLWIFG